MLLCWLRRRGLHCGRAGTGPEPIPAIDATPAAGWHSRGAPLLSCSCSREQVVRVQLGDGRGLPRPGGSPAGPGSFPRPGPRSDSGAAGVSRAILRLAARAPLRQSGYRTRASRVPISRAAPSGVADLADPTPRRGCHVHAPALTRHGAFCTGAGPRAMLPAAQLLSGSLPLPGCPPAGALTFYAGSRPDPCRAGRPATRQSSRVATMACARGSRLGPGGDRLYGMSAP